MQEYEYMVIEIPWEKKRLQKELDRYSADGWRLKQMITYESDGYTGLILWKDKST